MDIRKRVGRGAIQRVNEISIGLARRDRTLLVTELMAAVQSVGVVVVKCSHQLSCTLHALGKTIAMLSRRKRKRKR
jgi:hypothetical protein